MIFLSLSFVIYPLWIFFISNRYDLFTIIFMSAYIKILHYTFLEYQNYRIVNLIKLLDFSITCAISLICSYHNPHARQFMYLIIGVMYILDFFYERYISMKICLWNILFYTSIGYLCSK